MSDCGCARNLRYTELESKLAAIERELIAYQEDLRHEMMGTAKLTEERDALRAENEQIHTMNRKLERALSESTSYKQANKIVQLESQLSVAVEALKRISEHNFIEGKTGDPLYLLEICQEEAKEALAQIEGEKRKG